MSLFQKESSFTMTGYVACFGLRWFGEVVGKLVASSCGRLAGQIRYCFRA
jgi:hypothetical protein